MGNCNGYCNSCGDETTQINTLDRSQIKQSIKESGGFEHMNHEFEQRYDKTNNINFGAAGNDGQYAL
jgi:hypothetical protein